MAAMMESVTNDVFEDAREALASSPYADLRSLTVDFADGRLQVYGVVRSYYLKQLAQENLRGLALEYGFRITNHVDVVDVMA